MRRSPAPGSSSAPACRSGARGQSPSVTYADLPDGRVLDAVHYRKGGRDRLVLGADTVVGDGFRWRGLTPLTRLTSSRWRVVAVDEEAAEPADRWAVTAFEKTLFTPAGVDVYCRAGGDQRGRHGRRPGKPDGGDLASYLPRLFAPGRG